MGRWVTPRKRVTSPTWGPPPPCKHNQSKIMLFKKKNDFPIYIRDVETSSKGNQHQHNTDTDRNHAAQFDGNYPNQRPVVNQQINSMSSVQTNSEDNTTIDAGNRDECAALINSYSRNKAPIHLDTSTVINLFNVQSNRLLVQLTYDEIRLLSRGLTFCPTPIHIDWAQVKADGRRLLRWPTTAIHKYLLYYCILYLRTQTYSLAARVYLPVQ